MPTFPEPVAPRCFLDHQLPNALRFALIPILEKHHGKIPSWCERVEFFWEEETSEPMIAATTWPSYDYLKARIAVHPNFLTRADLQEALIVHELLHIQLEPLANAVKDLRDFLSERHPELKNFFTEIIRHAEERTVSSLTAIFISSEGED